MSNLKAKRRSLTLVAVISAIAMTSLYSLAGRTPRIQFDYIQSAELTRAPLPTVDYNASETYSRQEVNMRRTRSTRYNDSPLRARELPPNVDQLPTNIHFWSGLSSIPVKQSDAVIIGEVNTAEAYLSSDKSGVYCEFSTRVEQILKDTGKLGSSTIAVERVGGAVRFPSGRIIRYEIYNQGLPRIGGRYVLFLRYDPEGDDYSLLTGYELVNGRVAPLDSVEGLFTEYKDWPADRFLKLVTKAIKREGN